MNPCHLIACFARVGVTHVHQHTYFFCVCGILGIKLSLHACKTSTLESHIPSQPDPFLMLWNSLWCTVIMMVMVTATPMSLGVTSARKLCFWVVEHLPRTHEALESVPSTATLNQNSKQEWRPFWGGLPWLPSKICGGIGSLWMLRSLFFWWAGMGPDTHGRKSS